MPRCFRFDPSRLRDARRPLTKAAADALAELLYVVASEDTMPGEAILHAGIPFTAESLAAEIKTPIAATRRALVDLRDRGYVRAGEHRAIVATGGLLDLLPPPDATAADRKRKSRALSRDGHGESHDAGHGASPGESHDPRARDACPGAGVLPFGEPISRVPTLRSGTRARAAWIEPIAEAVEALLRRELRSLTPDERYLLARWHAFAFANCTRNEATNKTRSRSIAQGLLALAERLSRDDAKRDFRVGEYLTLGERLVTRSGGAPWYRPLDVEAEIEVEVAPA